jgi:hypothetical protein
MLSSMTILTCMHAPSAEVLCNHCLIENFFFISCFCHLTCIISIWRFYDIKLLKKGRKLNINCNW